MRTTPPDAYRFARGEAIQLPPLDEHGVGTTEVRLDRPLDFAAVTDHAEYLGEASSAPPPAHPPTTRPRACITAPPFARSLGLNVGADPPVRADFCQGSSVCADAVGPVWKVIQDAAEEAYDRTADCRFTTFVAYEYSLSPIGANLHRNVIFRNAKTVASPITTYEAETPRDLWAMLSLQCKRAGTGCDVLAIPHNSNLSNGRMFEVEYPGATTEEEQRRAAALRAEMEPLVEVFQHKGDSECILGLGPATFATDELCAFEKQHAAPYDDCGADGTGKGGLGGFGCVSWRDYLRGALETGLLEGERLGENPYKLGFIGSTDTHNGTPGATEETKYRGHLGLADQSPESSLGGGAIAGTPILSNPGGLAGVWADENSRDAIFDALRRRETFATSGTRIVVRMFCGLGLPRGPLRAADLVAEGYLRGVPMGVISATPAPAHRPRDRGVGAARPRHEGAPRRAAPTRPDREAVARRGRHAARGGVRRRRRPGQRRDGGHRHLRASGPRKRRSLRRVDRSRLRSEAPGPLLRARHREPDVPVEHAPVQQPPSREAGGPRLRLAGSTGDHPGARLDVTDLVYTMSTSRRSALMKLRSREVASHVPSVRAARRARPRAG